MILVSARKDNNSTCSRTGNVINWLNITESSMLSNKVNIFCLIIAVVSVLSDDLIKGQEMSASQLKMDLTALM